MKKLISVVMVVLIMAQITSITSYAKEESATELYKRDPDAFYRKYMCLDEEAQEQGLYSDANNGAFVKRNKDNNKSKKSQSTTSSYSYYSYDDPKGLVYGVDELHVAGLPTDERGYTKAGNYGEIAP